MSKLDQININDITNIAKEAGDAIKEIYERDFTVDYQGDKSTFTEADLKSNELICNALSKLFRTSIRLLFPCKRRFVDQCDTIVLCFPRPLHF